MSTYNRFIIICIALLIVQSTLLARGLTQVVTDGSVGVEISITKDAVNFYQILEKYGMLKGENLFHSFDSFDIGVGEGADFLNDSPIKNIFSRVTGGDPSRIRGVLRSKIPNANLYLLNPGGIIFGSEASLNIDGSFYASTADYIEFGSERFPATTEEIDTLQLNVDPSAFGFSNDNSNGFIRVNAGAELTVKEGNNLSFIGGDLLIEGEEENEAGFNAPGGQISIISDASASNGGNLSITNLSATGDRIAVISDSSGRASWKINNNGKISIPDFASGQPDDSNERTLSIFSSEFNATGNSDNSGNLSVRTFSSRGGGLLITNSVLLADGFLEVEKRNSESGDLSITNSELDSGKYFRVQNRNSGAGELSITDSKLFTKSYLEVLNNSSGGGNLTIKDNSQLRAFGGINVDNRIGSLTIENNSKLHADENQITVENSGGGLTVESSELSTKSGPGVVIQNKDSDGEDLTVVNSPLYTNNGGVITIQSENSGGGNLTIKDNSNLHADIRGTIIIESKNSGGGNLAIEDNSRLHADGGRITVRSENSETGDLLIEGNSNLYTDNRGVITIESIESDGGNLTIEGNSNLYTDNGGVIIIESKDSDGGNLTIEGNSGLHAEGGRIAVRSENSEGGNILIKGDSELHAEGGRIAVRSENSGGGSISIDGNSLLNANGGGGRIIVMNKNSEGGNVLINSSRLSAVGGRIDLASGNTEGSIVYNKNDNTLINSFGDDFDGNITILSSSVNATGEGQGLFIYGGRFFSVNSRIIGETPEIPDEPKSPPEEDIPSETGEEESINRSLIDTEFFLPRRCEVRNSEEVSSFVITGPGSNLPWRPEGLFPSP